MNAALRRHLAVIAGVGVFATVAACPPSPSAAPATGNPITQPQSLNTPAPDRALIDQYCTRCHNDRLKTSGLSLSTLDPDHVAGNAATWEKVARKLRTGAMPPVGLPRPDRTTAVGFVSMLTDRLDRAAAANPDPGRVTLHRLNRAEYANAVRDLLGVKIDSRTLLPQDDSDLGFDNMADILSVSPTLIDRYITAARTVARMALGQERKVGLEVVTVPEFKFQDARMSEDLPFGSRGGVAFQHDFPFDGQYVIKIKLARQLYEYIRGLDEPQQIDVRLDGGRVKLFTIGGDAPGRASPLTYAGELHGDAAWERYEREADYGLEVRLTVKRGPHTIASTATGLTQASVRFAFPYLRPSDRPFSGNSGIGSNKPLEKQRTGRAPTDDQAAAGCSGSTDSRRPTVLRTASRVLSVGLPLGESVR